MLRVLGRPTSINVRKVLWTLDELGLGYELEADWATPEKPTATPPFRALNPNALVPVLIDGDAVLWESNTICRYLVGRENRSDLLPVEPLARARVEMWMDWQATVLNSAWVYAFQARVRRAPSYTDEDQAQRSFAAWNERMALLDNRLRETGGHVAGEGFTLADIVIGLSVHRYASTPGERPVLPHVDAYVARLSARPAHRRWTVDAAP